MEFNYYYGSEGDQFTFIRIPKVMLTEGIFSSLSLQSKVLYGVLLDRMSLSRKNGWLDKENKVYIIYQINEIQENLGFSKKKAIDYLAELEKFGLVEKKRRGLGLPSILYVKSFLDNDSKEKLINQENSRSAEISTSEKIESVDKEEKSFDQAGDFYKKAERKQISTINSIRGLNIATSRSADMGTSRGITYELPEVSTCELQEVPTEALLYNNTYTNNTDSNNIKSNHIANNQQVIGLEEMETYSKLVKENIAYEVLLKRYPYDKEMLEEIFDLILEVVLTQGDSLLIASNQYPSQLVRSKFLKLDSMHVEYVLDCLRGNTTKIKNIKKYMLAALFNAPSTIKGYYQAEVNHDMPQYTMVK